MALLKSIKLDNGITVSYHRIVSINKITNNTTIIEVGSYIDEVERQKEVDYYNSTEENKQMNVFIETNYVQKEYNETDTIEELYDYLKTTEMFKDAENV